MIRGSDSISSLFEKGQLDPVGQLVFLSASSSLMIRGRIGRFRSESSGVGATSKTGDDLSYVESCRKLNCCVNRDETGRPAT